MAHFADDNSMDFSQTKIIYSIAAELEKTFGFGDEYTGRSHLSLSFCTYTSRKTQPSKST